MFYHYRQNNSGGGFEGPAINVIVEALEAGEADSRAKEVGVYFDGCADGIDCSCCGDRWYPTYDKGNEDPSIYGQPVIAGGNYSSIVGNDGVPSVLIYYRDGRRSEIA